MNAPKNIVTLNGNPLTLSGRPVAVDQPIPDAALLDKDLKPVKLSDYQGKIVILSVVPSLDTPVCDMQTRRFNKEAISLSDDVVVLTISMDLPFAQRRWCGATGVDRVTTLSDYRTADFGQATGLLIQELRLLARAVLVIDREGVVRYQQLVKEVGQEPEYTPVMEAVKAIAGDAQTGAAAL